MKSYLDQAIEMKLSLEAGLINVKDIIAWADSILSRVEYDDDLANICLATNVSAREMLTLLNRLIGDREEWPAARKVMARMYDILLQNPERLRGFIWFFERFWIRHEYEVPEDISFIAGIDDEFLLAEQGIYGTVELVKESLLANLLKIKRSVEEKM